MNHSNSKLKGEGLLAINSAILKNPSLTRNKLRSDLKLVVYQRTLSRALRKMGWRHVLAKYCKIIRRFGADLSENYNMLR